MQFTDKIDKKDYDNFNDCHPFGNALQSREWGEFKSKGSWFYRTVALIKNDELMATAMILFRKLPMGFTMAYIPRGFVLDYSNHELLKEMTRKTIKYVKKKRAIFLKIDPCVIYKERDSEGNLVEGGIDNSDLVDYLKELGYRHKGLNLGFEGLQPRYVYKLGIEDDLDKIMKNFHHKTAYNIRLAKRRGVVVYEGSRDDLDEFHRIMQVTGQRDGFISRPKEYFEQMLDTLGPSNKAKLFMAKYDVAKALNLIEEDIKKQERRKKRDEKKLEKDYEKREELKELIKVHPNGIVISGTILLLNGKTACYLYGASDNVYRNIMPNYLIQWAMIEYAKKQACSVYDFRGISGTDDENDPLYGLYRFKKGFNGNVVEYIGEFDYPIKPVLFKMWDKYLPHLLKILRKIKR